MEISTRALNAAKDQALRLVGRARTFWMLQPARRKWSELEKYLGIVIPGDFKSADDNIPFLSALDEWSNWYKLSVKARLEASLSAGRNIFKPAKAEIQSAGEVKNLRTVGEFELLPEQQAAADAVIRDLITEQKHKAGLQDGNTGSGKTVFAVAVLDHIIKSGVLEQGFYITPLLIFCPPTLMETWYRHLERGGLSKYIGNTIQVIPYSGLSATQGRVYITERQEYDYSRGQEKTILEWNTALKPYLCIFDECHRLKNDSFQTKAILALLKLKPYSIWMSATPFVTVNDSKAFIIATGAKLLDMTITEENFNQFASLICKEPSKPNKAAAKRLRQLLAPYIYSFPKVKWPHKAINSIILVDFACDSDREVYHNAYDKYLEKCRLLGKNTDFGRFQQFVALGQFRKVVEPLHTDPIVDKCHELIRTNQAAPIIGCAYRDTVIRAVFRLVELGYKRSEISVIWGGKEELKTKYILTEAEFNELITKTMRGEELTKLDIKKIQTTLAFKEEKANYAEQKDEETLRRLAKVSEFGLMGNQTPNQRQLEIDRFQNGESKICIFTLAAGGVGLSLDHWREGLLPRVGFFTPVYSGPEFAQALGRAVRRKTLSDTRQYIVGMQGTVEETHVMPLIDKKLQCIAEITASDYSLIDFHKAELVDHKLRTVEEAERDSEDEKTQLYNVGDTDRIYDEDEEEVAV